MQLDVFSAEALKGNPLAVVFDADDLSTETMQAFARWTNLSETTFVQQPSTPQASYRVRIFTPMAELPFAGHPSVGTAWALLESGRLSAPGGRMVQECGAGLLEIGVEGDGPGRVVAVQAPQALRSALPPAAIEALPQALGTLAAAGERPVLSDVGARWILVELTSRAAVRALVPTMERVATLSRAVNAEGIAVFSFEPGRPVPLELRAFAPATGVPEDPVTGSAHAAVGDWLHSQGRLAVLDRRYQASQGHAVGRAGEVAIAVDEQGRIRVGGRCCALIRGTVAL
jgi:PhzF family phenazine biosynthesis protein